MVDTVSAALRNNGGMTSKTIERWYKEMPREEEMLPKDKYTIFDRKERKYRKGIHSEFLIPLPLTEFITHMILQSFRNGQESVKESTHLGFRKFHGWRWRRLHREYHCATSYQHQSASICVL